MKIALISDIHGNYPALEAVLKNKSFQAAQRAYCLGDLVGYYPFPEECVKRVMRERIPCIMGNHDYGLVVNKPCRNNKIGIKSLELTRKLISQETINFLARLPKKRIIRIQGRKLFLVHGSPKNLLDGYVNRNDEIEIPKGFDVLAMGHTHKPFVRKIEEGIILNPGSVGQPRDGVKGACFAVIDLSRMKVKFFHASYNSSRVIEEIEKLGFIEAAEALKRLK